MDKSLYNQPLFKKAAGLALRPGGLAITEKGLELCAWPEKALVADFVPSEQRGTAFGIYHGAIGLAALPASLVFGLLWTAVEANHPGMGPKVAFGAGAALAAVASILLMVLLTTAPKGVKPAA